MNYFSDTFLSTELYPPGKVKNGFLPQPGGQSIIDQMICLANSLTVLSPVVWYPLVTL